jgi:hypothetical protein
LNAFEVGDIVNCKWNLQVPVGGTDTEPEDVSDFSYPREDEYYIEVIFMDEAHVPQDQYLALMIFGVGC